MADWYYTANGQQAGPVDLQTLRQMVAVGSVSRTELIYGPGLTQWTAAGDVPDLSAGAPATYGEVHASPVAAGVTMVGYRGVETGSTGLSTTALDALRQTKPWVRFISIMTFIGAGGMVLGGVSMMVLGAAMSSRRGGFPGWLGGIYLALAAVYVIPGVLLTRYANSIGNLMRTQRMSDVEQALGAQKSFWKFTGMMIIIVLCIYILAIAVAVVFSARF